MDERRQKFGNIPTRAILNDKQYKFKSKLEFRWAKYLEALRMIGECKEWFYEPEKFIFRDVEYGSPQYTPDFKAVIKNERGIWKTVYYETKGMLQSRDVTKYKRMADQYPEVKLYLVLMAKDKRNEKRLETAKRYIAGVIYTRSLFRRLGVK